MVTKVVRKLKEAFARVFSRDDAHISPIGSKPVETMQYVLVDAKERTVMKRQSSKRVTLPKKWLKREVTHVQMQLLKDPKTKDFLGIMVKFVKEEDAHD